MSKETIEVLVDDPLKVHQHNEQTLEILDSGAEQQVIDSEQVLEIYLDAPISLYPTGGNGDGFMSDQSPNTTRYSGLGVKRGFTHVQLSWIELNIPKHHKHTRVLRSNQNDPTTAVTVGDTESPVFTDSISPEKNYYYWLQGVTYAGKTTELSEVIPVAVSDDQQKILEYLGLNDVLNELNRIESLIYNSDGAIRLRLEELAAENLSEALELINDTIVTVNDNMFSIEQRLGLASDEAFAVLTQQLTALVDDNNARITQINELTAQIENESGLRRAEVSRLDQAFAGQDSAIATTRTELEALIETEAGKLAADILSEREASVTREEALARSIDILSTTVTDGLNQVSADIEQERISRSNAESALASQITGLESSFQTTEAELNARINQELTTLTTANSALAQEVTDLRTSIDTEFAIISADVSEQLRAYSDENGSFAESLLNLEANYTGLNDAVSNVNAALNQESVTRANENEALAQQNNTLRTEFETYKSETDARIETIETSQSGPDGSLAQRVETLEADYTSLDGEVSTNSAKITAEETARANADQSLSNQITTLRSDMETDIGDAVAEAEQYTLSVVGYCTIDGSISDDTTKASCEANGGVWSQLPLSQALDKVSVTVTKPDGTVTTGSVGTQFTAFADDLGNIKTRAFLGTDINGRVTGLVVTDEEGNESSNKIQLVGSQVEILNDETGVPFVSYDTVNKRGVIRGQLILDDGTSVSSEEDIRAHDGDTIYVEYQYSQNGTSNWHSPMADGDVYRRERTVTNGTAGSWSGATRIKGEKGDTPTFTTNPDGSYTISNGTDSITVKDGDNAPIPTVTNNGNGTYTIDDGSGNTVTVNDGYTPQKGIDYFDGLNGDFVSYVYRTSNSKPAKPSGGSFNGTSEVVPSSWSDTPTSYTSPNKRWVSTRRYRHNGSSWSVVGDWSDPVVHAERGQAATQYYTWVKYAKLFYSWTGSRSWQMETTIANAVVWTFDAPVSGKVRIGVQATDAEGYAKVGVDGTEIGSMSGADNATQWYYFETTVTAGSHDIQVWASAADGGSVKAIEVIGSMSDSGVNTSHIGFAYQKTSSTESTSFLDYQWSESKGKPGPGFYTIVNASGSFPSNDQATVDFVNNFGKAPEVNDHVTYVNSAKTQSTTKRFNGSSWIEPSLVVNGDALVKGTVTTDALAAKAVSAAKIDVDDLFAQDITATGTISGLNLTGARVEARDDSTGKYALLDSGTGSPIIVNDGTRDVLRFDSDNKLILDAGLGAGTINDPSVFSQAIWDQIRMPVTEGATGGSFSGPDVVGQESYPNNHYLNELVSEIIVSPTNTAPINVSFRFYDMYGIYRDGKKQTNTQWRVTITAQVRSNPTDPWGSISIIRSSHHTAVEANMLYITDINISEAYDIEGLTPNGQCLIKVKVDNQDVFYDLHYNAGEPKLSNVTAIQQVQGGGAAGAASLLNGKEGSYYLDFSNFTNVPTAAKRWPTWNEVTDKPTVPVVNYVVNRATLNDSTNLSSGFFTTSEGLPNPDNSGTEESSWWHVLNFKHGHNNGYAAQLALELSSGTDAQLQFRTSNGSSNGDTWTGWYKVYSEQHKPTWNEVLSKPETAIRWPTPSEVGAVPANSDITITKNKPWLTLDSSSSGENNAEQAAGVSIGESGQGAAALHLTYTGDGRGWIGMGAVSNAIPQNVAMEFYYTNNIVIFKNTPKVNGSLVFHEGHRPSWGEVDGKPSSFTPSSHNHSASNITSGTLSDARLPQTLTYKKFQKDAHAVGAYSFHAELYSPEGTSSGEVSLLFHQGNRFYYQLRANAGGMHVTRGNNSTLVPLHADFRGDLQGEVTSGIMKLNGNSTGLEVLTGSSGGWARGISVLDSNNARLGGAGFLGGNNYVTHYAIGYTSDWWSGYVFAVSKDSMNVKVASNFDDKVVIKASGTIAGSSFDGGWLQVGDSSNGWAIDPNEIYCSGTGIIGTLGGDLQLRPVGQLDLKGSKLTNGGVGTLRVTSDYGYIDIGSKNSSWAHFYTDRNQFYMSKQLHVDGAIRVYSKLSQFTADGNHVLVGSTDSYFARITNNGDIARRNSGWANNSGEQKILRNSYVGNVGDYIQLQPSGNRTTNGTLAVGTNGFAVGLHSLEEITADVRIPFTDTWMSVNTTDFWLSGKRVIRHSDSWLRLNEDKSFSSGIYCGGSTLRTDGNLQVGSSGSAFNANTGQIDLKVTTRVHGRMHVKEIVSQDGNFTTIGTGELGNDLYSHVTSTHGAGNEGVHIGGEHGVYLYSHPSNMTGGMAAGYSIRVLASDGASYLNHLDVYKTQNNSSQVVARFRHPNQNTNVAIVAKNQEAGSFRIEANADGQDLRIQNAKTDGSYGGLTLARFYRSGNMQVTGRVTAADHVATSDRRVKDKLEVIEGAMAKLDSLTGYTYDHLTINERKAGLIAQDVEKVLPEAVTEDDEGIKQVSPWAVIGLLVNAVNELSEQVKELQNGNV